MRKTIAVAVTALGLAGYGTAVAHAGTTHHHGMHALMGAIVRSETVGIDGRTYRGVQVLTVPLAQTCPVAGAYGLLERRGGWPVVLRCVVADGRRVWARPVHRCAPGSLPFRRHRCIAT